MTSSILRGKLLHRRTLLRGVGGFALSLPLLDAMIDEKHALAAPTGNQRYVVLTSGQAAGIDGTEENFFRPANVGRLAGQTMAPALSELTDLLGDFSLVSGLQIPCLGLDGYDTTAPVAGKIRATHDQTLSPMLAGKLNADGSYGANGPTTDYLVAQQIAGSTIYKQLNYRVQLAELNGHYSEISFKAADQPVNNSVADPAVAWQTIFGNFSPPSAGPDPVITRKNRRARSVLDAIIKSSTTLSGQLGAKDRIKLSNHLDQVRDLEKRIAQFAIPSAAGARCVKPSMPGDFTKGAIYNDEIKRGELLADLVSMALICDLTRVASLLISFSMPMFTLPGHVLDIHEESHQGTRDWFLASQRWHLSIFGRILRQLKAVPEGNGTALDNTLVVFALEGGHGRDGAAPGATKNAHSTDNMVMLVGGNAGGKLKRGHHIQPAPMGTHPSGAAKPRHPASVFLTCMNAMGVTASALGDVQGTIPELLA
jgi:Protein of unknown function (DUF1552)